jgi:hypothetical protein
MQVLKRNIMDPKSYAATSSFKDILAFFRKFNDTFKKKTIPPTEG